MTITVSRSKLIIAGLIAVLLVVSGIGIYGYTKYRAVAAVVEGQKKKMMEQDLELGKAQTIIGNTQKAMKDMSDDWQKWLKDNGSKATDVGYWKARYEQSAQGNAKINVVIAKEQDKPVVTKPNGTSPLPSCPLVSSPNYQTATQPIDELGEYIWIDTDKDGKPDTKVSEVDLVYKDYRIDINADALKHVVKYSLHQNFEGQFVKAVNPTNGAVSHFLRIWELDDKGSRVKQFELTDFKTITEDPTNGKKKWFLWNPQVDLGANISVSNRLRARSSGEIGISTSGYGKTADDNAWRLFRFSLAKNDKDIVINFAPACWNAGKSLPLVKDLYLCPTVGMQGSDTVVGFSVYNPF